MSTIVRDSPANEAQCPASRKGVSRDAFVFHFKVKNFEILEKLSFDEVLLINAML
jgi:hypothetical protein